MRRGTLVIVAVLASGCATISRGTLQTVTINTPGVHDATCTLTSSKIGTKIVRSPGTVTIEKGPDNIAISCKKECYQDGVGVLASSIEPMTAGNILVGGVIGLGVDAVSGAMSKYEPEATVHMTRIPSCRSAIS